MGEIKNLNFGMPKRKKFSIDGDENRVIELDTGDTGIMGRWSAVQEWIEQAAQELETLADAGKSEEQAASASKRFAEINAGAREKLNFLFDTDVCTPIAGNGALIRMVEGEPLFMRIIDTILPLYEADIKVEYEKSKRRIEKHTAKYAAK